MRKKWRATFVALVLALAAPLLAAAQEAAPPQGGSLLEAESDAAIYATMLEGLLARDYAKAEAAGQKLALLWPDSPYTLKATAMLGKYGRKRDTSGIVPFYIGSLATGTGVAAVAPGPLIGLRIKDQAVNGSLYIAGAVAGLGAAWYFSKDGDFTLARDLWIESVEIASLVTWLNLFEAWYPEDISLPSNPDVIGLRERVELLGLSALMLGTRIGTYAYLSDRQPSLGQAAFAAQASAWSFAYSAAFMNGVLEVADTRVNNTVTALALDSGLVLGAVGWNGLHWSAYRSGLVSVGGLAGAAFGGGLTMILGGLIPGLNSSTTTLVILSSSIAGHAAAIWLTRGMEEEAPGEEGVRLGILPVFDGRGAGVALSLGISY